MIDTVVILVSELAEQAATRARGKEAYRSLLDRLSSLTQRPLRVIVDMTARPAVTGSFMDELVLRMSELPDGISLVFRLASRQDLNKLEDICAIRGTHCSYQIGETKTIRSTKKTAVPRLEAQEYSGAFFSAQ